MGSGALVGRYWPADSPVHALDPRTKLVGMVVAMVAIFLANSFPALAVAGVFVAAFYLAAHIPLSQAVRAIGPLLIVVLLAVVFNLFYVQGGTVYVDAGWLRISEAGVHATLFLAARVLLLLLVATLPTLTTTTLDLTDALEHLTKPLGRIGFPAHEFAMVLGIALRFLPQFAQEWKVIRAAQASRAGRFSLVSKGAGTQGVGSLIVPLFASAFRHADTLSSGMDARCYHGGVGRTRLHPLAFGRVDIGACVALVALMGCVIAANAVF